MEFSFAKDVLRRLKTITTMQGVPGNKIRFTPVGLGEPLLYPYLFEILDYGKTLFPKAYFHINTNGTTLSRQIAKRLITGPVDRVVISLSFDNSKTYREQCGADSYAFVSRNIEDLLILKGDHPPSVTINLFDKYTSPASRSRFKKRWLPFLNKNDSIQIGKFIPLTDWSCQKLAAYPCDQLWHVLQVDVDGYAFPCCMGVWIPRNNDLSLGNLRNDISSILEKLQKVRQRHQIGDWGLCIKCPYLFESQNKCRHFHNKLLRYGLLDEPLKLNDAPQLAK